MLVKKVPGTLHFVARAPGHSFDYLNMNLSHMVHYLYYGNKPSPRCGVVWKPGWCLCGSLVWGPRWFCDTHHTSHAPRNATIPRYFTPLPLPPPPPPRPLVAGGATCLRTCTRWG